jgi:hypothetical protein
LALHAAIVSKLIDDPERLLAIARRNLGRDYKSGTAHDLPYSREWESLIAQRLPTLIEAMLDPSDHGITLLLHSFTGVLNQDEVRAIKRIYRKSRAVTGVA